MSSLSPPQPSELGKSFLYAKKMLEINKWINKQMNEGLTHWLIDWLNEWMNEWVSEWMSESMWTEQMYT